MEASSLITSSVAFPLGSVGHKVFQSLLPGDGTGFLRINPTQLVDLQKLSLSYSPSPSSSAIVDVQDGFQDSSVLFSFGIAEQCGRREKILRYLTSGSNISDGGALDFSVISDLMGLHTLSIGMPHVPEVDEFGLYEPDMKLQPQLELVSSQPSLNNLVDYLPHQSAITNNQDGKIFVMGTEAEIKDSLSVIAEVYMSQSADRSRQRRQMVIPYFTRSGRRGRNNATTKASANIQSLAPAKSVKQLRKKEKTKSGRKRKDNIDNTFYTDNCSHVCESLLSVFLIKNQNESALHSLKKYGHKFPGVLMQLSSAIAGTGLAVLFSVVWNHTGLTAGRMSLSAANTILNTGFGVGLVWLSLSINKLRDTIINIRKNMTRQKLKDDEMTTRVEKSVNEVFLRAAAVMVLVAFRFA
ncbi:hypothetical protein ZOSMA_89G00090 [Zostera marina]|uniref:Uncharacterized protein n=1 Tax=Zostera marina TaxID=29655 RepID=A0A0K9NJW8_ZOSMR|nr:hypothetical protein ZOSMA_89G00090 [Zostera marina]